MVEIEESELRAIYESYRTFHMALGEAMLDCADAGLRPLVGRSFAPMAIRDFTARFLSLDPDMRTREIEKWKGGFNTWKEATLRESDDRQDEGSFEAIEQHHDVEITKSKRWQR
eukprot:TRINITY_DN32935_c1_g1_i3.p2 TRINITY_DN32935_c1_g1~~TRINITY_DN32935_c1_g1_i3.p2  ORF type:complete len:114 (+),score=13.69 TRINITY_DN32935_c1_g1_i3:63-404(+)